MPETSKLTDAQVREIITKAQQVAAEKTNAYLEKIGGDQYPCGFAWVHIKPARGQFVKVLKDMKLGRTDDYLGGFMIWNPSENSCQNVYAKEVGAQAFAEELRKYGVNANMGSRWD